MGVVIVGAGLAGISAAEELRTQGYEGAVTLVGAEPHPPYQRPPLSKGLLLGKDERDSVFVKPPDWFDDNHVQLRLGEPVGAIDTAARTVAVGGEALAYDELLLATGSRPRHLGMADRSGAEVVHLRTLEDSEALRPRLGGDVVVIGAGWIGLEVAAAAREAGGRVTVVESAEQPLLRVLGPVVARSFADLHREHGVDLRLGAALEAVEHRRGRTSVWLAGGVELNPDLVVVGIGAEPETELAAAAGLAVDDGVLVDACLRTSDPHVLAAGDVANHDHPDLGRVRVEHWDNAIHQGRHAARTMLGDRTPYRRQPYFFTDQYDLGMEYVGRADASDEVVVRGDLSGPRVFNALWLREGRVVAGMHANDWDAIDALRGLVGTEADDRVRDVAVPLADLARPGDRVA